MMASRKDGTDDGSDDSASGIEQNNEKSKRKKKLTLAQLCGALPIKQWSI